MFVKGSKVAEADIKQMALRIALGCTAPSVSQAILGEGNDAATRLVRAGDAIYNDRRGEGANPVMRIAMLPTRERLALIGAKASAFDWTIPDDRIRWDGGPAALRHHTELERLTSGVLLQTWLGPHARGRVLGLIDEVSPADPRTYAIVLALFAATACAALIVPARRALGVDPVTALRAE